MLTAVLSFSLPTFAQKADIVQLVYFYPKDRPINNPKEMMEIAQELNTSVGRVKDFYQNEMRSLGFGNKTFDFQPVKFYAGKSNHNDYFTNAGGTKQFNRDKVLNEIGIDSGDVYLIAANLDMASTCGLGLPFLGEDSWLNRWLNRWLNEENRAWAIFQFPQSGDCTHFDLDFLIAHELGHAFGLEHDFRTDDNIMSYNFKKLSNQTLSPCAAEWLEVCRAFNKDRLDFAGLPIKIEGPNYSLKSTGLHISFKLTNFLGGLHSAQLHVMPAIVPVGFYSGVPEPSRVAGWSALESNSRVTLYRCESLGSNTATIEFVYSEINRNPITNIQLSAIDKHGNLVQKQFKVPINYRPMIVNTIAAQTLTVGDSSKTVDVSNYFRDPEGESLTYTAVSSNPNVAITLMVGSQLTVWKLNAGNTTVAVTATDPGGLYITQTFNVTVTADETAIETPARPAPQGLNIGDAVVVQNTGTLGLNIRSEPEVPDRNLDNKIGKAYDGATGTITAGTRPDAVGRTWWEIEWDPSDKVQWQQHLANQRGWSVEAIGQVGLLARRQYDLAIGSLAVSKNTLEPGEAFTLTITLRNEGPSDAPGVALSYYHSAIQGFSTADPPQVQGTVSLNPLASGARMTQFIQLVAPSIPKTYYYGAYLAANSDDTHLNNDVATEISVTVMATTVQTPNLPNTEIPATEVPPSPEIPTTEVPPPPIIPKTEVPSSPEIPTTEVPPTPNIPTTEVPPPPIIPTTEVPPTPIIPTTEVPPPPIIPTTKVPPPPIIPGINWGFNDGSTQTENVCDRTQQVLNAIFAAMDVDDCANLDSEDLDSITTLVLSGTGITALQKNDFEGLSGLDDLDLHGNSLSSLPVGLFDELRALKTLDLKENALHSVPADVFDELGSLRRLDLKDNGLTALPGRVFDSLKALESLNLKGNQLTTLPKGIFDEVLDTLESDSLSLDDSLKATVGFETTTQTAAEGDTVEVKVTLNRALPVTIRVPYTIGGTATTADYRNLYPRNALSFRAGETSAEIVFTLFEDADRDAETISLALGKLSDVEVHRSGGNRTSTKLSGHAFLNPTQQGVHTTTVTPAGVNAAPSAVGPNAAPHLLLETALLSNYPNPFNPETWIPYRLAAPADVSIAIYTADGQLVRRLDLGHKAVGIYESRSRAAYWSGRNAQGESVASGVYFYTLTAGEFTATRKMLIRK